MPGPTQGRGVPLLPRGEARGVLSLDLSAQGQHKRKPFALRPSRRAHTQDGEADLGGEEGV